MEEHSARCGRFVLEWLKSSSTRCSSIKQKYLSSHLSITCSRPDAWQLFTWRLTTTSRWYCFMLSSYHYNCGCCNILKLIYFKQYTMLHQFHDLKLKVVCLVPTFWTFWVLLSIIWARFWTSFDGKLYFSLMKICINLNTSFYL